MAVLASVDIPFLQHNTDSQSVDSTGALASAIFTNLPGTKQREIMLRNRGSVNVNLGQTLAKANWPIEPGDVIRLGAKDLSKVALKAASGTATVDILQVI